MRTEIIRAGIESISKGQIEAGLALNLSRLDIFRYVILKPALRAIYPALTSQFILLMLSSRRGLGDLGRRTDLGGCHIAVADLPQLRDLHRRYRRST